LLACTARDHTTQSAHITGPASRPSYQPGSSPAATWPTSAAPQRAGSPTWTRWRWSPWGIRRTPALAQAVRTASAGRRHTGLAHRLGLLCPS